MNAALAQGAGDDVIGTARQGALEPLSRCVNVNPPYLGHGTVTLIQLDTVISSRCDLTHQALEVGM